jgi:hypothetical protein
MSSLFDSLSANNSPIEGEARRDAALGMLRIHRAAIIRKLTAAALRFVLSGGEVCADDIREDVPLPDGISPRCVGVVFRDLSDAGILRRLTYRPSTRPIAHARPLSVWTLADRDAATAHLAALEKIIAATEAKTSTV